MNEGRRGMGRKRRGKVAASIVTERFGRKDMTLSVVV